MLRSRNRLLSDLERWQKAGWVTPTGADAIRADITSRRSRLGLAQVLAIMAAVLVGFAVMSFVAANWQAMPKLARLAVIFAGLWLSFAGAAGLRARSQPGFADAALLAGTAIYGAGIMLIAQMYHMDGHPPDAVLLWGGGTVAVGLLTRCNPVLAAALVLFGLWSLMESFGSGLATRVHWAFLPAWGLVAAGFAMTRWRPGLHLLALTLSGWIVLFGYLVEGGRSFNGHVVVVLIGAALAGSSIGFGDALDRWRRISGTMLAYGFTVAFLGALGVQFATDRGSALTLLLGALVWTAIVGVLGWAWRTGNRAVLWLAYGAFTIEILALYIKKIGTLLGTSAFFLVTGLVVGALAYAAFRLHDASQDKARATP